MCEHTEIWFKRYPSNKSWYFCSQCMKSVVHGKNKAFKLDLGGTVVRRVDHMEKMGFKRLL